MHMLPLRAVASRAAAASRPAFARHVARRPSPSWNSRWSAQNLRRQASTSAHSEHSEGSDTLWIVGSLVVFAPTVVYLTSPPSKSHTVVHDTSKAKKPNLPSKIPKESPEDDDEGGEAGEAGEKRPPGPGDTSLLEQRQNQGDDAKDAGAKQNVSSNTPGTLQPDPDKFAKAKEQAKSGDTESDPKKVVAEHEADKEKKGKK